MRGAGTEGKQDVGYSVAGQTLGGLQRVAGSDRAGGQLPPLVAAAHGEGKGETSSGSVDLGMMWGCRRCGFGCGVLVGGMGGAGRWELPPRGGQNVKRL